MRVTGRTIDKKGQLYSALDWPERFAGPELTQAQQGQEAAYQNGDAGTDVCRRPDCQNVALDQTDFRHGLPRAACLYVRV